MAMTNFIKAASRLGTNCSLEMVDSHANGFSANVLHVVQEVELSFK